MIHSFFNYGECAYPYTTVSTLSLPGQLKLYVLFICRISLVGSYKNSIHSLYFPDLTFFLCAGLLYGTEGHAIIDTARRARDFRSRSANLKKVIKYSNNINCFKITSRFPIMKIVTVLY